MKTEKKKETARVLKFILFSASAGIIETVAMILCEEVIKIPGHWVCYTIWNEHFLADIHGWNEYAVLAINMALNLSLEYLWDNFVVYRNSKDTNDIAKKKQEKENNEHE